MRRRRGGVDDKVIKRGRAIAAGLNASAIGEGGFVATPNSQRIGAGGDFNHAIIDDGHFVGEVGQHNCIGSAAAYRAAGIIVKVKRMRANT